MAGFVALGVWQLRRMHEKQAMLDAAQRVLERREAQPLSAAGDVARSRAYDWAAGEGVFAEAPARPARQPAARRTQRRARLSRVPAGFARRAAVAGRTRLVAVARRSPHAAGPATAGPATARRPAGAAACAWHRSRAAGEAARRHAARDFAGQRPRCGRRSDKRSWRRACCAWIRPIRSASNAISTCLPNTLPPERHLGYAVQWFALALAVLVTALVLSFRTSRRSKPTP